MVERMNIVAAREAGVAAAEIAADFAGAPEAVREWRPGPGDDRVLENVLGRAPRAPESASFRAAARARAMRIADEMEAEG